MDLSKLEEMPEIRPFPQTATQVMSACDSPDTTPSELCEIIQCDPGIAMKIVQVSNSSAYGLSGEVRTLQHAVVVLGYSSLKSLAISIAAQEVFAGNSAANQSRDQVWQHSMGCAAVAGLLANHVPSVSKDEAFLGAIVHDVGKLALIDAAPEEYAASMADCTPETVIEIERNAFGLDHQAIGLQCAEEWGLPYDIADAIGGHHDVYQDNENPDLVNLIGLADNLAQCWEVGSAASDIDLETLLRCTNLGFDEEQLTQLREEAHERFDVLRQAFGT